VARIREGRSVQLDEAAGLDATLFFVTVVGPILGVALAQRGNLVLHGSAVRRDGMALAIVGESEQGKSTLAAALARGGWGFVADDLVPVTPGPGPRTIAGYPMVKLFPEAAASLGLHRSDLEPLDEAATKVAWRPPFVPWDGTLGCVVVLGRDEGRPSGRLGAGEAIAEIVRCTYVAHLLRKPEGRADQFAAATDLIRAVPVVRVAREPGEDPVATSRRIEDVVNRWGPPALRT
jgi:hypothetical protein